MSKSTSVSITNVFFFFFSYSFVHSTHASSCGAATQTTRTSAKPRRAPHWTGPSALLEKLDCKRVSCLVLLIFFFTNLNSSYDKCVFVCLFFLFRSGATKATACGRTPTRWGKTAAGAPGASWAPALDPAELVFASGPASATTQREFCSVASPGNSLVHESVSIMVWLHWLKSWNWTSHSNSRTVKYRIVTQCIDIDSHLYKERPLQWKNKAKGRQTNMKRESFFFSFHI